jgi:Flp pilus assembly protein TadG
MNPSFARRAKAFLSARSGVAVVEFAFILPIGLVLLMAMIDFTRAFNESKRLAMISSTLADIVSQQPTTDGLSVSGLDAIITAATAIMTPYSTSGLAVTVSAIQLTPKSDQSCCQAKVQWSVTRGGSLRPCSTPLQQVPAGTPPAPGNMLAAMVDSSLLASASSAQMIIVDVQDRYSPLFSQLASFFSGAAQRTSYRALRAWGNLALQSGSSSVSGEQVKVCFSP